MVVAEETVSQEKTEIIPEKKTVSGEIVATRVINNNIVQNDSNDFSSNLKNGSVFLQAML